MDYKGALDAINKAISLQQQNLEFIDLRVK